MPKRTAKKSKKSDIIKAKKMRIRCPLANNENYQKKVFNEQTAKAHADSVHRILQCPCPLAKEYDCSKDHRYLLPLMEK